MDERRVEISFNMNHKTIIKYAFLHAVGAAGYIALVAAFMTNANKFLGQANKLLGTMAFLLTLVISVATMGLLIFGRPAMWYINGSKKEAVVLSLYTIGFLVLIALIVFSILAMRV